MLKKLSFRPFKQPEKKTVRLPAGPNEPLEKVISVPKLPDLSDVSKGIKQVAGLVITYQTAPCVNNAGSISRLALNLNKKFQTSRSGLFHLLPAFYFLSGIIVLTNGGSI